MRQNLKYGPLLFVLLIAFLFPFGASKFQTYLVTQAVIFSILAILVFSFRLFSCFF